MMGVLQPSRFLTHGREKEATAVIYPAAVQDIEMLCKEGQLREAFRILDLISNKCFPINSVVYKLLLQGCMRLKALAEGKQVHSHIIKCGVKPNIFLANLLLNMYAKCGSMAGARFFFDKMHKRNAISWTIMISGYARLQHGKEALKLFRQMQQEGLTPDKVTFVSALNACASLSAFEQGKQIHAHIIQSGCESNPYVSSTLVSMYAKCGRLMDAQKVFEKMLKRDVVVWNALITGHVKHGQGEEALRLFQEMREEDVEPSEITFVGILDACASLKSLKLGRQFHSLIIRCGFESDLFVATSLIHMYAACGSIELANQVFDKMPKRDVASWNAMIGGYAQFGNLVDASKMLGQMRQEGLKPDKVTFVNILNACANLAAIKQGKQVHTQIIDYGLESDMIVASALISMYVKCSSLDEAREVFEKMPKRDAFSWTSIISGCALHGMAEEALKLFQQMQEDGVKPDKVTFLSVLEACASLTGLEHGKAIHAQIIQSGFGSDLVVGNTLIHMYAKCGSIECAQQVFESLRKRDVITWNAIIAGYAQHGQDGKALECFHQMELEGILPDKITFIAVLNACANLSALERGRQIHAKFIEQEITIDAFVGNTLMHMYAKCGEIDCARQLFEKLPKEEAVPWNTMITSYAQHGKFDDALKLFMQMRSQGVKPDKVTFLVALSACSHSGLVDEGQDYFISMTHDYGIIPREEHYACMVDLFGRAGHLEDAESFMLEIPVEPRATTWLALLGASRTHGDIELAKRAAKSLLEVDPLNDSAYILLSNIYAGAGRWEGKENVKN